MSGYVVVYCAVSAVMGAVVALFCARRLFDRQQNQRIARSSYLDVRHHFHVSSVLKTLVDKGDRERAVIWMEHSLKHANQCFNLFERTKGALDGKAREEMERELREIGFGECTKESPEGRQDNGPAL